jgi:hypothetical protein
MASKHEDLSKLVRLRLSEEKLAKLWQNNTGTGKSLHGERLVSFGLKGSTDNIGLMKWGQFIGIEIKIPPDKLKPDQENFRDMILNYKGLHFVIESAHDIEVMIATLTRLGDQGFTYST